MFIEELGQHLCIASREEAMRLTRLNRGFWNVISIHGPDEPRTQLPQAKRVHRTCFDDSEDPRASQINSPAIHEDLTSAFDFARSVGSDPLLVHCTAGVSRSPAVALAWACHRLAGEENFAAKAVDVVLRVRPQAMPNLLVLRLGLAQFLPAADAAALTQTLANHPRLMANRFGQPP